MKKTKSNNMLYGLPEVFYLSVIVECNDFAPYMELSNDNYI